MMGQSRDVFLCAVCVLAGLPLPARPAGPVAESRSANETPAPDPSVRILKPSDAVTGGAPAESLVYSSTLGREAFEFFGLAGDDILMTGSPGCLLSRYRLRVDGDTTGDSKGPFSVNFALYRDCPRLGPTVIPGTAGTAHLPDEGEYLIEFVVPGAVDVPLPQTFWMGANFDRPGAGWLGGYPPEVGYSRNRFAAPIFGCNALFGADFPGTPYGAFYAQVFVREPCSKRFAAYLSTFPERPGLALQPGEIVADDLQLGAEGCLLAGYELGVRDSGVITAKLHFDKAGLPGAVIPGTEATATTEGFALQFVQRTFDPPIFIPNQLWISAELVEGVGLLALVSPPPTIGNTQGKIARFNGTAWVEDALPDPQNTNSGLGLNVTLYCEGQAPLGACCDPYLSDELGAAVCRDVAEINCPFPPRGSTLLPKWRNGVACDADPFDPPCGSFACCRANAICENVPRGVCFQNGVSWSEGVYCDGLPQACEFVCIPSLEDCTVAHPGGGCSDPFCCREICDFDPFCCDVVWDRECVLAVTQLCAIPPANDECEPDEKQEGATLVTMPTDQVLSDHRRATENPTDPGFCCHAELPGAQGVGTVWYKFVATGPIAELNTCTSNSPASDALLQVLAVKPHAPGESDCDHLQMIGCNDDAPGCSVSNHNARLCLTNLIPGHTYYVMVAAKSEETRGNYRLGIATSCIADPFENCPCPAGSPQWIDPPDGVVDARSPRSQNAGIDSVAVLAPSAADRLECWSLCVEADSPGPAIEQISASNGITQLALTDALPPGSAATLSYTDGFAVLTTAAYFTHPGNINADGIADAADVLSLVNMLNDIEGPPWGLYSQDIDHSGALTPLDLWEEINTLLGAEMPGTWLHSSAPPLQSCP